MRARSASTQAADPYRAGIALGDALRGLEPEVVFLFSSIHYSDSAALLEGIYDSIGRDDLILIGTTGDGFYASGEVGDSGVAALGLSSDGRVRWQLAHAQGVGKDCLKTTRTAFQQMREQLEGREAAFMYVASDFRLNASEIESIVERETQTPVIGGFAADDNRMERCAIYVNRSVFHDSIALLAAEGEIDFRIFVGNALAPIGRCGVVSAAEGMNIHQIDGHPAMGFIEAETGKPVLHSDHGVASLTVIDPDEPQIKRLRSIVPAKCSGTQSLGLYGGIEVGSQVQVCLASADAIVDEVYSLADGASRSGLDPAAALIVSCVGRKWLLGKRAREEVDALTRNFGEGLPTAGFPSFGEFAPLRTAQGYSRNLFHNMTYVLLLIGKA